MLRGARIEAEWLETPGPEEIRRKDRDRLIEALLAPVEADDEDREIARELLAQRSPEEIAAALVRAHRAAMPAPEELVSTGSAEGRAAGHRAGFEDTVWFRMDIGRRHNADPRWLLPLICRRGHVTKNEIGAIRIGANETHFQIPRADGEDESGVRIEVSEGGPREVARVHRKGGRPNDGAPRPHPAANAGPRGKPKPHHKGPRGPRPG